MFYAPYFALLPLYDAIILLSHLFLFLFLRRFALSSCLFVHNRITSILFLFARRYLFSHYICRNMIEDRMLVCEHIYNESSSSDWFKTTTRKKWHCIALHCTLHGGVENKSEMFTLRHCVVNWIWFVYTSSRYRFTAHRDLHKHLSSVSICVELFSLLLALAQMHLFLFFTHVRARCIQYVACIAIVQWHRQSTMSFVLGAFIFAFYD